MKNVYYKYPETLSGINPETGFMAKNIRQKEHINQPFVTRNKYSGIFHGTL